MELKYAVELMSPPFYIRRQAWYPGIVIISIENNKFIGRDNKEVHLTQDDLKATDWVVM